MADYRCEVECCARELIRSLQRHNERFRTAILSSARHFFHPAPSCVSTCSRDTESFGYAHGTINWNSRCSQVMTCPECGSSEIRASRSTRWKDVFQRVRGREPFRCRKCRLRFFSSQSSTPGSERVVQSSHSHRSSRLMSTRTKKRLVRQLVVIAIFAVALVIFLFFLRYLTTEPSPSQNSGAVSSHLTCSPS